MRSWLKKKSNKWILSASFVTKPTSKQWNFTYIRRKDTLRGTANTTVCDLRDNASQTRERSNVSQTRDNSR
jgi:hypothetical protein